MMTWDSGPLYCDFNRFPTGTLVPLTSYAHSKVHRKTHVAPPLLAKPAQ
jgi:hypothetical protein